MCEAALPPALLVLIDEDEDGGERVSLTIFFRWEINGNNRVKTKTKKRRKDIARVRSVKDVIRRHGEHSSRPDLPLTPPQCCFDLTP